MPRIRALDPHVVNQIAAGEVVDRPASVVKELVENALDAGATQIDVSILEGGRARIEVSDNGWGMEPEDLRRAFLPHATSKVEAVGDLEHVGTMGFRGEALASIGSVAHVTITSREPGADEAWRIENRFGEIGDVVPAGGAPGTVIAVDTLFARVPARRKFLRTPQTEGGHISDLMGRFAVAFPHVGFRLAHGSRTVLTCPRDETRRGRIERVYGADVARPLLEVEAHGEEPTLHAFIGPPSHTRRDGRMEQVYLNGRFVRDRTALHALREAYRDLLPPGGRRPIAFVFLSCDPSRVDVNVHPAKAEVRWRDPGATHRVVRRALRQALEEAGPGIPVDLGQAPAVPEPFADQQTAFVPQPAMRRGTSYVQPTWTPSPASTAGTVQESAAASSATPPAAPIPDAGGLRTSKEGLRPLAQALGTYLLLEGEGELVLVDQHALHERVLFDQINTRLREEGRLEVQRLLVPEVVHLEPASVARLTESADILETLGWLVEAFGEDAVAVQGVPAIMRRPDPAGALAEILEILERGQRDGLDRTALVSETVDSLACRSAVMAGDTLHPEEVIALLEQAEALNHSHSCPHGRPTRLTMSRASLEKWFHRTV